MADFFQPADPQSDPKLFAQYQQMAQALMKGGAQGAQGQNVNGQFVAPGIAQYASQLGQSALGGYMAGKAQDANRASTILNGGADPGRPFGQFGNWLGGFFGGS